MATTGELIKLVRAQNNLTQEELGDILGLKKSAIQKYESGAIVNFKTDVLRKFYLHFNLPPLFLVFPEEVEPDTFSTFSMLKLLKLNQEGRDRVLQYGDDLLLIDKYRRQPSEE